MSKSSNTNDINMVFIDRLINAIGDLTAKIDELCHSLFDGDFFDRAFSKHMAKYDSSKRTTADLEKFGKSLAKDLENFLKVNYNVGITKRGHSTIETYFKRMAEEYSGKDISRELEQMKNSIKNLYSSMTFESIRGAERGEKRSNLYFTNTLDNEKLKSVYVEFAKIIGVKFESSQYKLMSFFQGFEQGLKKTLKTMGEDLVEGLEKSKWVGGTLRDTFKLIGLLGANWMSQFGQFGKILGGAFYVAMEVAGPLIVRLLIQGMGKLFLNLLPNMIGRLIMGSAGNVAGAAGGGALSGWLSSLFTRGGSAVATRAATGMAAEALIGGGALATTGEVLSLAGGGAVTGGAIATTGGALAAGGGGAATGAAAAGATTGGIALGPILLGILAVLGVIAAGVAIWKNWDKIEQHFKKNQEFYGKVLDFFSYASPVVGMFRWITDHWPFGGSDGAGGTGVRAGNDTFDRLTAKNVGRLKIAKDGSVLNATDFTQSELAAEMQAYQKAHPKEFSNIYEVVGSKYANMASFQNDAIMTDQLTGQKGAIMYKGAMEDMERIRQIAISKGMDPRVAERILYSSGWSTKTSGHSLGALGHGNRYGLAYDIGLAGFNTKEQQWILEAAQERAAEKGKRGQWVRSEANVGGKTVLSESLVQGANMHLHAQMPEGYFRPVGADENERERQRQEQEKKKIKALSAAEGMKLAGDILQAVNPEKYEEVTRQRTGASDERMAHYYNEALKKEGIVQSDLQGKPYFKVDSDGTQHIVTDLQGNILYNKLLLNRISTIANVGVD